MDGLLRMTLMGGEARAILIDSTRATDDARIIHSLSRTATAALGRLMTGALAMGAMLKDERDSITVSVRGDGELGGMLAVSEPSGDVKGYVNNPSADPERKNGKLNVGGAVGRGTLTVVRDMGLREPYVGQTELVSGEIGEDLASYFVNSEQTPSLVSLGVLVGERVEAAGGLIIQMLPGASEAAIASVENSVGMFSDISASIRRDGLFGTLRELLTHLEPEVLGFTPVRYHCGCTRERVERAILSLGRQEIEALIREKGEAEVGCSFCNMKRTFNKEELEALLAGA